MQASMSLIKHCLLNCGQTRSDQLSRLLEQQLSLNNNVEKKHFTSKSLSLKTCKRFSQIQVADATDHADIRRVESQRKSENKQHVNLRESPTLPSSSSLSSPLLT